MNVCSGYVNVYGVQLKYKYNSDGNRYTCAYLSKRVIYPHMHRERHEPRGRIWSKNEWQFVEEREDDEKREAVISA